MLQIGKKTILMVRFLTDVCVWIASHLGYEGHSIRKLPQNDFLPGLPQAIIWTNAGILFIRLLGTSFTDILR